MYFWDELRDYKYCAKCGYHEGKKLEDVLKEKPVKAQDTITKKIQEQIKG
jgi:Zn ribbon nucleic-acid-binding protein